jgi:alpha-tubulin suppressor-like RCC1 family protein
MLRHCAAGGAALALVAGACMAAQVVSAPSASAASSHATTIAGGFNQSCMIRSGLAFCWGNNASGQLGNNTTISSSAPVAVYTGGVLAGVILTQITAGENFTCALGSTGAAYCWGANASGQLGNNTTASSSVPVAVTASGVLAGVTVTQITAGTFSACALGSAGAAYCWGLNSAGQLGNNTTTSSAVPVAVTAAGALAGVTLTQISTPEDSAGFACALGSAGAAYCWGSNASGQLGNNTTTQSNVPVAVTATGVLAGKTLTQISTGDGQACALASTGAAYCWGANSFGQLGNNSTAPSSVPVAVSTNGVLAGATLVQISAGASAACALGSAGAAYCWGIGTSGSLGNNSTTSSSVPVAVSTAGVLAGVTLTQITDAFNAVCATSSTGADYCWGTNAAGQLGNPATSVVFHVPAVVSFQATMIAAGSNHSCMIRNGKAFCWGGNGSGQLGNNSTADSSVPVAVSTTGALSGVALTQITAGNLSTCALGSTGLAYCWGNDSSGQLGNNSTTQSNVPVAVTATGVLAGKTLTQITAGSSAACALGSTGLAYCWGNDSSGQLGNNSTTQSNVPVAVAVTTGVLSGKVLTQLSTSGGGSSTCAVDSTGLAYCWGLNGNGQLGNNTTTSAKVPVAVTTSGVLSGKILTQISVGSAFACALDSTGFAYCWGLGSNGQLGNNTVTSSSLPVAVTATGILAGKALAQITSGSAYSCALDSTGAAYCWGLNGNGQLGNNTVTSSSLPVTVTASGVLSGTTLTQITAGSAFTGALDSAGAAYCWGLGSNGQLGNNTTTNSKVPVIVQGIVPGTPTGVSASPGDTTALISWTAPASFGTGTLTGYTAATPGGLACFTSTTTTCTITGLTDGTTYTITVVTHTTDGDSPPSGSVTVTPAGVLSITVPASATLPGVLPGGTASAQLGTVTVTDGRGAGSWTATVTGTTFVTGAGTAQETIPLTRISYWSGIATATTGTGTLTPGQANAAAAVNLSVPRLAFSLTGGSPANSASWNPTLSVSVPASAVAGTYTATITQSVA